MIAKEARVAEACWKALQSITIEELKLAGRVYGGGLYKLEPKELANVPLTSIEGIDEVRKLIENSLLPIKRNTNKQIEFNINN